MKKTTWLLLALSLVAMLLVAGCAPTTPAPTESPSPTPTVAPTAPPVDDECPKPVSTVIGSTYDKDEGYVIKLTITFNEPITSGCIEDPSKWDIIVKNSDRQDTELTEPDQVKILGVELSTDNKKAYVYATVKESNLNYVVSDVVYTVNDVVYVADGKYTIRNRDFKGLICSEDDAKDYATPDNEDVWDVIPGVDVCRVLGSYDGDKNAIISFDVDHGPKTPKVADVVEWKLKNCVVSDELGNACCDYSGSACCLEPTCATCEEGCPLGSEGSCL